MPQDHDYDDLDDDLDDETPEQHDNTPKGLRRAAKEGAKAKAEAARLARELALTKAGIDTDSPLGSMFAKSYDGELTKEAVTSAWKALGVAPAPQADEPVDTPSNPDPEFSAQEIASTKERQALANNAPPSNLSDPDPRLKSIDDAEAVRRNGGTGEDAIATMFTTRVNAEMARNGRPEWTSRRGPVQQER